MEGGKQMARMWIAAFHMLPEKSSLNVNFVCPICSDCPDDRDDHGNDNEHGDYGNNDDQIGVALQYNSNSICRSLSDQEGAHCRTKSPWLLWIDNDTMNCPGKAMKISH